MAVAARVSPRTLDARDGDAAVIAEAVAVLRRGGLVALPTETVYGLAARALDPAALRRIFVAKDRPLTHPLIAHVLDLAGAAAVADDVEPARALAAAFWPGPLTVILRRGRGPAELSAGLPTVAVRAPAHPVARAVIAALGEPIAAPSANRHQQVSPTTAAHVARSLGEAVDLILDGGATEQGIESTVVDLTGPPTILRPGPIDEATLRAHLPGLRGPQATRLLHEAPRSSPGLDARHYAPRAPARRFADRRALSAGARDGVLFRGAAPPGPGTRIALPDEPVGYARGLYAALHALDDAGVQAIWIEDVPADVPWAAVRDRLTRATR